MVPTLCIHQCEAKAVDSDEAAPSASPCTKICLSGKPSSSAPVQASLKVAESQIQDLESAGLRPDASPGPKIIQASGSAKDLAAAASQSLPLQPEAPRIEALTKLRLSCLSGVWIKLSNATFHEIEGGEAFRRLEGGEANKNVFGLTFKVFLELSWDWKVVKLIRMCLVWLLKCFWILKKPEAKSNDHAFFQVLLENMMFRSLILLSIFP
jgi:hypothetical protein